MEMIAWYLFGLGLILIAAMVLPFTWVRRYYIGWRDRAVGDGMEMSRLASRMCLHYLAPTVRAFVNAHDCRDDLYSWRVYPTWRPQHSRVVIKSKYRTLTVVV